MSESKDLPQLRNEIGALDKKILELISERICLAKEVGRIKAERNLPIKDYRVEKHVLERNFKTAAELGLYKELTQEVSQILIKYAVLTQDVYTSQIRKSSSEEHKSILVVGGLGGMGRWMSQFFRSFGHDVCIFDPAGDSMTAAQKAQQAVTDDFDQAVTSADIIVVSTPISVTEKTLDDIIALSPKALVFDICSLKSTIVDAIERGRQKGINITSVHPMFGPELDLLAGRNIIICKTDDDQITKQASELFKDTTANIIEVPLADHDRLMGYVLGLSHMINLVFAQTLVKSGFKFNDLLQIASTTFKSQIDVVKPVSNENQDLYFEIQVENSYSESLINAFKQQLDEFLKTISQKDRKHFKELMENSKLYLNEK